MIPLSGARAALVVGGTAGRGVQASATMGRLRSAIRTLADIDLPPGELLTHLDDLVPRLAAEDDPAPRATGATCLYAVYAPVSRRFEVVETELSEGSVLALCTDGLVQGRDRGNDQGLGALCEAWPSRARPWTPSVTSSCGLCSPPAPKAMSPCCAIHYGHPPIRLRLIRDRALIREVRDASSTAPRPRRARALDEGGRGLGPDDDRGRMRVVVGRGAIMKAAVCERPRNVAVEEDPDPASSTPVTRSSKSPPISVAPICAWTKGIRRSAASRSARVWVARIAPARTCTRRRTGGAGIRPHRRRRSSPRFATLAA